MTYFIKFSEEEGKKCFPSSLLFFIVNYLILLSMYMVEGGYSRI